jgi:hypothetical protein
LKRCDAMRSTVVVVGGGGGGVYSFISLSCTRARSLYLGSISCRTHILYQLFCSLLYTIISFATHTNLLCVCSLPIALFLSASSPGNNPYAYSDFGDAGILVARLKGIASFRSKSGNGKVGDAAIATSSGSEPNDNFYNSIVVGDGYSQMVVLGESSQCIPLLHFPRSMIDKHKANHSSDFSSSAAAAAAAAAGNGGCAILYYQEELQKIVDEFFNQGIVPPRSSTSKQQQQQPRPVASRQMDTTQATMTAASTMATTTIKTVVYQVVYMVAFMAIVGTIVSMSVSLCLFLVNTMSSLSSSRFIEL